MIYGATGYTGRLAARGALERGLLPVLCGRSESKLAAVSRELGLGYRVARLEDAESLDAALHDVDAVLHTAGPFSHTWRPMAEACLRTRTHYLDISGEIPVIESLRLRDAEARERGVMLMPAVGFDVVPSDCLGAHLARRLPGACRLRFGYRGLGYATPGSAKTLVEQAGYAVVRRGGAITQVPPGALQRHFDYGDGASPSINISWGDVATAYYTTGIPNVEVYFETTVLLQGILTANRYFGPLLRTAPWQAWLKATADMVNRGPTRAERAAVETIIVGEAEDVRGSRVRSRMRTPEVYSFTAVTAPAVAERVLSGDFEVGFQTPARVYGADFALSLPRVTREDLE
jgi:short subunit dehydrogenase-like uncharacterized protein